MSESSQRTFSSDFRQFFLRGLVVLLPSILTLWIVVKAWQFVDSAIAEPINQGIRITIDNSARVWEPLGKAFNPSEESINTELDALRSTGDNDINADIIKTRLRRQKIADWWNAQWYMRFIGIVVAIVAVYFAGRLLGGFFGRRIYRRLERLITTLPVFKQVYPYIKQVVDFLFSDDQPIKFNRVVAAEYPRKGIWSVGFLTGGPLRSVADHAGDVVTIFIPSSPTPFTGYTITVKQDEIIEIPITVEEAIRFAVSGAVPAPEHQAVDSSDPPRGLIPIPPPSGPQNPPPPNSPPAK